MARGEALDDGSDLDDMAPDSFSIVGRKRFGSRAHAYTRLAFLAEDDRPGPSEIAAPAATLLDAGGGWRFTPNLELRGIARNLLNDEYYASPDPRFVLAPGRSISVSAVVVF